jgi:hypothetical protein
VDWIGLAQDMNRWRALVNWVLNLRVPWNAGKLSSDLTSSGLSSSAQLHGVKLVSYTYTSTYPHQINLYTSTNCQCKISWNAGSFR